MAGVGSFQFVILLCSLAVAYETTNPNGRNALTHQSLHWVFEDNGADHRKTPNSSLDGTVRHPNLFLTSVMRAKRNVIPPVSLRTSKECEGDIKDLCSTASPGIDDLPLLECLMSKVGCLCNQYVKWNLFDYFPLQYNFLLGVSTYIYWLPACCTQICDEANG